METLVKGFSINVFSEKSCQGLLVSILEVFEELGLNVLEARVSCTDSFQLQAIGEVRFSNHPFFYIYIIIVIMYIFSLTTFIYYILSCIIGFSFLCLLFYRGLDLSRAELVRSFISPIKRFYAFKSPSKM